MKALIYRDYILGRAAIIALVVLIVSVNVLNMLTVSTDGGRTQSLTFDAASMITYGVMFLSFAFASMDETANMHLHLKAAPLSSRAIVGERYLLLVAGIIAVAVAAVIGDAVSPSTFPLALGLAFRIAVMCLLIGLLTPIAYKFGVQRAVIVFFMLTFVGFAGLFFVAGVIANGYQTQADEALAWVIMHAGGVGAAIIAFSLLIALASYFVSVRVYARKM